MTVLKYRDPDTGEWVPLDMRGADGQDGPTGPAGAINSEVSVGAAQPVAGEDVWVSTAGTLRYNAGGTYRVPSDWCGERLVSVGTPTAASDAATLGYRNQGVFAADAAWKPVVLESGWRIHGGDWAPPVYRKLSDGVVIMQGLITGGEYYSDANNPRPFTTMPVGYRPLGNFNIITQGGGDLPLHIEGTVGGRFSICSWASSANNQWASICMMYYAG